MTISSAAATYDSGLFASVGGTVENLSITSSTVVGGAQSEYAGILAGDFEGTATNITLVNDTITDSSGSALMDVGLLAGSIGSGVAISAITVTNGIISLTQSTSAQYIGGVAGYNAVSISDAIVTDTSITYVGSTAADVDIGGIAGFNQFVGQIASSSVSGGNISVSESGSFMGDFQSDAVGGLVGDNQGSITQSSVTGTSLSVTYTGMTLTADVGGLVGINESSASIADSFATGGTITVTGTPAANSAYAGGFVGDNSGQIVASSFGQSDWANMTLSIDVSSTANVGGFAGNNETGGSISQAYALGDVDAVAIVVNGVLVNNGSDGGFVGANRGSIDQSFASGSVFGLSFVGGFVGYNLSFDSDLHASIADSYAVGSVSGASGAYIGGFVGLNDFMNDSAGLIYTSYSTGLVAGSTMIGGFAGRNNGSIIGSYWGHRYQRRAGPRAHRNDGRDDVGA